MNTSEFLAELARRGFRLWRHGDRLKVATPADTELDPATRAAIVERREALMTLLDTERWPVIEAAPCDEDVRCSLAQQRFLFSAAIDGSAEPYRLNAAIRVDGPLDVAALSDSLVAVVDRHDALRMRFEDRDFGAVILPSEWRPTLNFVEYPGSEAELLSRALEAQPAFDLYRGPHLAVTLYRLTASHHILFLSMHHIVSDGSSNNIIAADLQAFYARRTGADIPDPLPPRVSFRDIAHAEQRRQASDWMRRGLAFWKESLEGAPTLINLPTDHPRPPTRESVGGSIAVEIGAPLVSRVRTAAARSHVSEFQLITAALALLLHLYSHERSIVIGTPWRDRDQPDTEQVVGPLLNLLPLHIGIDPNGSIADLLAETRARSLSAITWGSVPFEAIVSHVAPVRSAAYTPLFQVMCAIEPRPFNSAQLAGVTMTPLDVPDHAARYDLALVLRPTGEALKGALKFDRALFDASTAERMAGHLMAALELVADNPERRIAEVSLMSADEHARMLVDSTGPHRDYPLDRTLVDLVADAALRWPDRIAVIDGDETLTYGALEARADGVARELSARGVMTDQCVAITLPRSSAMVVAMLGVLKTGAAYLPIAADLPPDRKAMMIAQAGARAVIGQPPPSCDLPRLDTRSDAPDAPGSSKPAPPVPQSACYIIYTSGSTGRPKGVITDHRAIVNNLAWMNDAWPLDADDAVLFKSSPGFDVSVKEVFWPLIAGARLVVASPGAERDPKLLRALIERYRVTVAHFVPTMLDAFLRELGASTIPHLRIVMCGGEALTAALRARFHHCFDATLLHMYGPTEAAIAVTGTAFTRADGDVERLPLGRPMPNCRLYVVDANSRLVTTGAPGELCIAGVPLARGYSGDADLTAEKFVPDPFSPTGGERMYRTGDLARWRTDGQLEYLGRLDRQIKLRGLRIELGEIEAALRDQPGIEEAVVVARGEGEDCALSAYLVTREPDAVAFDAIRGALRQRLPPFMIPSSFAAIAALPATANGKVDLAALPAAEHDRSKYSRRPPVGPLEEAVAGAWREVLAVEWVNRDDDFFDIGGHSLLVLRLQSRLRRDPGVSISIADLFNHSTIADLAAYIAYKRKEGGVLRWPLRILRRGRDSLS